MTFVSSPYSEGEWDFYWCDVSWLRENFDHIYMEEHVRINHFRNHYEVSKGGGSVHLCDPFGGIQIGKEKYGNLGPIEIVIAPPDE